MLVTKKRTCYPSSGVVLWIQCYGLEAVMHQSTPGAPQALRTHVLKSKILGLPVDHFWFKSKSEDSLLKALDHLNLKSLTLLQEQVNAIRNVVENQKWPEVLKSKTVSSEPPGPRTQGPRRLWEREWVRSAPQPRSQLLSPTRRETSLSR